MWRPNRAGFFDLPAELRLGIYDYIGEDCRDLVKPHLPHHCRCENYYYCKCRPCRCGNYATNCIPVSPAPCPATTARYYILQPCRHAHLYIGDCTALLNDLCTTSQQFGAELRAIWLGYWTHCIQDDDIPDTTAKQKFADFPKLCQFVRSLGIEACHIKRVRISQDCGGRHWPDRVPDPGVLEQSLAGLEGLQPGVELEIIFSEWRFGGSCTSCTVVLMQTNDRGSFVEGQWKDMCLSEWPAEKVMRRYPFIEEVESDERITPLRYTHLR